eukprot:6965359-Pyramimonas_sp.AAC.1
MAYPVQLLEGLSGETFHERARVCETALHGCAHGLRDSKGNFMKEALDDSYYFLCCCGGA